MLEFSYQFINKNSMEGRILGGNMRCFLKLAGTKFWPAMEDKILLLEASGGEAAQMASCLAQLRQIGVFEQIRGILLGTFLSMEENSCRPSIERRTGDGVYRRQNSCGQDGSDRTQKRFSWSADRSFGFPEILNRKS